MQITEYPPKPIQPEDALPPQRGPEGVSEQLGGVIMHNEVPEDVYDAYIEEGLDLLSAHANRADVREEDAGRMHAIDEAYQAAELENEMFNAHTEALIENEKFEATPEEAKRELEKTTDDEEPETEEPETEEQNPETSKQTKGEDTKSGEASEAGPADYRNEATQALKEAGYHEEIPASSHVRKDPTTGALVITSLDRHDIKVIEPQSGGRNRVTNYAYDEDKGIVTITAQGRNAVLAHTGEHVPTETLEKGRHPKPTVITLPPAVARALGFSEVTPFSQAQ